MKTYEVTHKEMYVPDVVTKVYDEESMSKRYTDQYILKMFGVNKLEIEEECMFPYDFYVELTIKRLS